jgi:hypothetical protein
MLARDGTRQWLVLFPIVSLGAVAAVLLSLWAMSGFEGFGLSEAGAVFLVLGTVGTSGLGVGLMALVFYSDRSSADEDAYHSTVDDRGGESGDGSPTEHAS